jgi:hypothetical protein
MGTIESDDLDGAVNYDTPVPFAGFGDEFPGSGELLVTGADNATLRLVALENGNVRIDADYDGDGTIDEVINMSWAELAEQS